MKAQTGLVPYISQAIAENWDSAAMTNFRGNTYLYRDVARKIAKLHILFEQAGLKTGDKIAFCARNSAEWSIAVLASLTYGSVAVPILHDFKADTIHHLINHSDARLLFCDKHTWKELDFKQIHNIEGAVLVEDYSLLDSRSKKLTHARENLNRLFGEKYPWRFTAAAVSYPEENADALALINYTSGSTGFSKGVMLSYGNLWSNLQYCIDGLDFLKPGDTMVSMLPLAHMFGLMVEMIHTFVKGCHIYFITKTPTPSLLLDAFAQVKPKMIVAVPLIIEKIVRNKIFPILDKPLMKLMLHLPLIDNKIYGKVSDKLSVAFGGNLKELIIGGAPLGKDVETFLKRINFPYTVGYGMTECGPLIAYCPWDKQRPSSCGRIVDRMEIKVDSPNPSLVPGVISVKGANVMQGYYKNEDATKAVLSPDGWMNTGDIAQIDSDGYIYIRGRDKNMILGPSGQNIYPEEIEQKLNNMPYVGESLVVDRNNKLVALIHPDYDLARQQGVGEDSIPAIMKDNISKLNPQLPSYSQISDIEIMKDEFEKTPKRSIRRFLYK